MVVIMTTLKITFRQYIKAKIWLSFPLAEFTFLCSKT